MLRPFAFWRRTETHARLIPRRSRTGHCRAGCDRRCPDRIAPPNRQSSTLRSALLLEQFRGTAKQLNQGVCTACFAARPDGLGTPLGCQSGPGRQSLSCFEVLRSSGIKTLAMPIEAALVHRRRPTDLARYATKRRISSGVPHVVKRNSSNERVDRGERTRVSFYSMLSGVHRKHALNRRSFNHAWRTHKAFIVITFARSFIRYCVVRPGLLLARCRATGTTISANLCPPLLISGGYSRC